MGCPRSGREGTAGTTGVALGAAPSRKSVGEDRGVRSDSSPSPRPDVSLSAGAETLSFAFGLGLGFGFEGKGADMLATMARLGGATSSLVVESSSSANAAARRFRFTEYVLIGDDLLLSSSALRLGSKMLPVLRPFSSLFPERAPLLFPGFHSGSSSRSESLLDCICAAAAALARLAARLRGMTFWASGDSDMECCGERGRRLVVVVVKKSRIHVSSASRSRNASGHTSHDADGPHHAARAVGACSRGSLFFRPCPQDKGEKRQQGHGKYG
jgi:hypothetical protein